MRVDVLEMAPPVHIVGCARRRYRHLSEYGTDPFARCTEQRGGDLPDAVSTMKRRGRTKIRFSTKTETGDYQVKLVAANEDRDGAEFTKRSR